MRTEVSAEEMCCSPQASKLKGTALETRAATAKCPHQRGSRGRRRRRARTTTSRTAAPSPTLVHATVVGVIPRTATLMNRKDQPQMPARTTSSLVPPPGRRAVSDAGRAMRGTLAFPGTVSDDGEGLLVDGARLKVLSERDPANLPWKELGAEIVIESTGLFTDRDKAQKHAEAMARHRAAVLASIEELEKAQDELLDKLVAEPRSR